MMQSLCKVSKENNYCKPQLNNEGILEIKNGRHPVIEANIDNFVQRYKLSDEQPNKSIN